MFKNANIKDAVYLIDDDSLFGWGGLRTSWDYVGDGEGPDGVKSPNGYYLINSDKDGEVYVKRDCVSFEGGLLTFEMLCENISGEGAYIAFGSRTSAFLKLVTKGEELYIDDKLVSGFKYGKHYVKLIMDLDKSMVKVYIDTKLKGDFSFNSTAFTYNCLKIGYGEKDTGAFGIYFTKMYVNYLANDACLNRYLGKLPDEYSVKCTRGAYVKSVKRVPDERPEYTYQSKNKAGSVSIVKRPFTKASGNVVFEIMYLLKDAKGKIEISLNKGANRVVSVYDEGEELHCYCGSPLRKHHKTVWQTLRIYADTDKNTATIWLNGKKTKTVDFECTAKYLDNFRIKYEAVEDSSIMFSDILLWVKPEEPEDYVPAPIVPKKKGDYVVGMNICSLWREGTHAGWDCISPYDDVKPLLGFYDEGLPETSDWEIKWMVEHGIDYELYCWYSAEQKEPIKTTHLHHAWVDGHFYAKYADMEKFALLWEAANCKHPQCLQDFKDNLVPYWLDYFFSDDRYMTVDNKAIMSCFGVWCVERDLGGAECVREGLNYLRDEVKKLGYDDLIVMGCHADPVQLKNLGFDAHHAYHWGSEGYKLDHNKKSIQNNIARNGVHAIPTVSVGFKNVGWGGDRRPNLSAQDMYKGLVYCMDEVLPTFEKNSWKSKMLHLSTWNEYGEGTYIMPSGLNGFGYLDAIRRAVCVDEPHEDIVPTPSQQARIGYLRPQNRYILKRTKYDKRALPTEDKVVARFTFKTNADLKRWKYIGMENLEISDGKLKGRATQICPEMELKKADFDASKIAYAKVVLTNRHADNNAPTVCYIEFTSDENRNGFGREAHNSASVWCNDLNPKEYIFELDDKSGWRNTIHGLRLVPTYSGTFELESITFYEAIPHKTIYNQKGTQLFFGDYLYEKCGEVYVPLDPESGILKAIGYDKFEWLKEDRTLKLWNKENVIEIVIEKPYAIKNGENYTLIRPAFLKDGIPAIALSDIEMLFGVEVCIDGDKIYIK